MKSTNLRPKKLNGRPVVLMIKDFVLQQNQTLMKVLMDSMNIQRLREQLMKKKCQNGINFVNE
jgi:hypothetical protein